MQWTPDRNAGFSTADFEPLYLPPLMDPVYGYQAVNVEAERRNPGSFLHWLRRMIASRKRHPQLALGSYTLDPRVEPVDPGLPAGTVRGRPGDDPLRGQPLAGRAARRDPAPGSSTA